MFSNILTTTGQEEAQLFIDETASSLSWNVPITDILYVSPDGDGSDGSSWEKAYQTIQSALDVCSTDANALTLIQLAPHGTNYDINTTGDPTWSANVIIQGPTINWCKIMNTHGTATSIMKLTGKTRLQNLNFNLGSGSVNGVILTKGGFVVNNCMFVGEDLTGAVTATKPFIINKVSFYPSTNEIYEVRLSEDAGSTFFDTFIFEGVKNAASSAQVGERHIFNAGTPISASARDVSGADNVKVWLTIQEI